MLRGFHSRASFGQEIRLRDASLPTRDTNSRSLRFADLITQAQQDDRQGSALRVKLPMLLRAAALEEKVALINELIEAPQVSHRGKIISQILKSAQDLYELYYLVQKVGPDSLLALKNSETNELAAKALISTSLLALPIPAKFQGRALRKTAAENLAAIKSCLKDQAQICRALSREYPALAKSAYFKHSLETIDYNLKYLAKTMLSRPKGLIMPAGQLREFGNSLIDKIKIESRYGLLLTNLRDNNGRSLPFWNCELLGELKTILAAIPEWALLFTPRLREIKLTLFDGGLQGLRSSDGLIEISLETYFRKDYRKAYPGQNGFRMVLAHEIGHAIQLGSHNRAKLAADKQHIVNGGDPIYDFERFMALSGWKVIPRGNYRELIENQSVLLYNAKGSWSRYPLGIPNREDDKVIVYSAAEGKLFSYNRKAGFADDQYSRASPWEDWATCFSEYLFAPQRLRECAPLKFEYFNKYFKKWQEG